MKPGSVFIDVTYGHPESRIHHFKTERFQWTVESEKIGS